MTDSLDNKSKEKHDNLDVDLDAMLGDAESSLHPMNEVQDDEDVIDRLLVGAGFDDADDALMQTEVNKGIQVVKDAERRDELDDFLSFEGFEEDLNEPEMVQQDSLQTAAVELEQASPALSNEPQDDEDTIDKLLMTADIGADNAVDDISELEELDSFSDFSDFKEPNMVQQNSQRTSAIEVDAELADKVEEAVVADLTPPYEGQYAEAQEAAGDAEELIDFSDFSDFGELEIIPAVEADEPEQTTENASSQVDKADRSDDANSFDGVGDNFDASDMLQDDEEASVPMSFAASNEEQATRVEQPSHDDSLLKDSYFDTKEGVDQTGGEINEVSDDLGLWDQVDDFDELDIMTPYDEVDASAPDKEQQPVVDEADEQAVTSDFSDFSDFNELEIIPTLEAEESEKTVGNSASDVDDTVLSDEVNRFSEIDGLDEANRLQVDETETLISADFVAPNEEQSTLFEQPSNDEDDSNNLLLGDADFDAEDVLEPADLKIDDVGLSDELDIMTQDGEEAPLMASLSAANEGQQAVDEETEVQAGDDELDNFLNINSFNDLETVQAEETEQATENPIFQDDANLSNEDDNFSYNDKFSDDLDKSDMILDDEVEVSALADLSSPNEAQQTINEWQDDETNIDSLLMDTGFDAEDTLEQMVENKDEHDDTDFNDFFQLDEVSGDFSKQAEEVQSIDIEKSSTQDDQAVDSFLPDFDITADMEISDMGNEAGIKEDAFGDTDFLHEDTAVNPFVSETEELKSDAKEVVTEQAVVEPGPTPAPTGNTTEEAEHVNFNPFDFEQEEMKKQLEDAENKLKKARLLGYAALGFGAVVLSGAVGLGVMTYDAKTEVSELTKVVSTLEINLTKTATNNPNEEISAMRDSVVQLNQQVDGFITELKGNPQSPVDLLNNKVPNIVAKQDMVSKALDMLQVKMGGGKVSLAPSVAEPPKVEAVHEPAPLKEGNTQEIAPVKIEAAPENALIKLGTVPENAPAKAGAVHEILPTKDRAVTELVPTKEGTVKELAPTKQGVVKEFAPSKEELKPAKQGPLKELPSTKQGVVKELAPTKEGAVKELTPAKQRTLKEHLASTKQEAAKGLTPAKEEPVQALAPTKDRAAKEAMSTKEALAPARVKTQLVPVKVKPVTPEKTVVKQEAAKEKPVVLGRWGVNLGAFRQEWFARSKAAEFAQQGIFAEVIPVHEDNATMYRLRVGGFKTKAEANSKTAKIKKALNLDSVWVSDN